MASLVTSPRQTKPAVKTTVLFDGTKPHPAPATFGRMISLVECNAYQAGHVAGRKSIDPQRVRFLGWTREAIEAWNLGYRDGYLAEQDRLDAIENERWELLYQTSGLDVEGLELAAEFAAV